MTQKMIAAYWVVVGFFGTLACALIVATLVLVVAKLYGMTCT